MGAGRTRLATPPLAHHIRGMRRLVPLLLLTLIARAGGAQASSGLDASLQRLVGDYTGLYTKATFARWRELFLPTFTATSTTADGGVTVRRLEEFTGSQERAFAAATRMGERLENVQTTRRGRMATIVADFVYWNNDIERRGRLILTAIQSTDQGWRFASLMFSYHD